MSEEPKSNVVSIYWYRLLRAHQPTTDDKIQAALDKQSANLPLRENRRDTKIDKYTWEEDQD